MNEMINVTPLPTTRVMKIIQGMGMVTEWTDSIIDNLSEQVADNLGAKDVQGNIEVRRIFLELRDLLIRRDVQGLKSFSTTRMAEGKELAEAK